VKVGLSGNDIDARDPWRRQTTAVVRQIVGQIDLSPSVIWTFSDTNSRALVRGPLPHQSWASEIKGERRQGQKRTPGRGLGPSEAAISREPTLAMTGRIAQILIRRSPNTRMWGTTTTGTSLRGRPLRQPGTDRPEYHLSPGLGHGAL